MLLPGTGLDEDNDEPRGDPLTRTPQGLIELHRIAKLLRPHAALDDHLVDALVHVHTHPAQLLVDGKHLLDVVHLADPYQLRDEAVGVVAAALLVLVARGAGGALAARLLPGQHLRGRGAPRPGHRLGRGAVRARGARRGAGVPRLRPRLRVPVQVLQPVVRLLGCGRLGPGHVLARRALEPLGGSVAVRAPAHRHGLLDQRGRRVGRWDPGRRTAQRG
mmetsp:Transcript_20613/g.59711  ORF Transcript_20613/g.59711 Transcript_20613/m.59711 type:complete len:219 (-) Transcript_20613:893-1549(-)